MTKVENPIKRNRKMKMTNEQLAQVIQQVTKKVCKKWEA
jgi:hypothetical protein